ncbi:MAG TPA: hypothetical protein PL037_07655, partial [Elusimicrobiales bacterium]|nr:hypothetical protein [Elusimicrobiales bacterium]
MPRATSKPSGKAEQPEKTDITRILKRQRYGAETLDLIRKENLLPAALLTRLHRAYPGHSAITGTGEFMFTGKDAYAGLSGLREIAAVLAGNGIELGDMEERELFIHVYRFMATKHVLNMINWKDFRKDPLFQLVFPQPGMIRPDITKKYLNAAGAEEKKRIVADYMRQTNPHDGKQKLNKPWFIGDGGEMQVLDGSQHKYPQCQLLFDAATQNCFAFCTYCFRHAQVRGDEDMFSQEDISQVHAYLRKHTEVSDILITGGDAGYITFERFQKYALPLMEDERLSHIKTVRLGSRALTFQPGLVLTRKFDRMLALFRKLTDSGIQVVWMSHFSTPREVLNPTTIAAIRRLKAHGLNGEGHSFPTRRSTDI